MLNQQTFRYLWEVVAVAVMQIYLFPHKTGAVFHSDTCYFSLTGQMYNFPQPQHLFAHTAIFRFIIAPPAGSRKQAPCDICSLSHLKLVSLMPLFPPCALRGVCLQQSHRRRQSPDGRGGARAPPGLFTAFNSHVVFVVKHFKQATLLNLVMAHWTEFSFQKC